MTVIYTENSKNITVQNMFWLRNIAIVLYIIVSVVIVFLWNFDTEENWLFVYRILKQNSPVSLPNQKIITKAKSIMCGNHWLLLIRIGIANEARKLRVGYHRLPKDFFLYWKMQLETTMAWMAIIGISKCILHGHENHRNSNCFRW